MKPQSPEAAAALLGQADQASHRVRRMTNRRSTVYAVWAVWVLALFIAPLLTFWGPVAILATAPLVMTWQRIYLRRGEAQSRGTHDPVVATAAVAAVTGIPIQRVLAPVAGVIYVGGVVAAVVFDVQAALPIATGAVGLLLVGWFVARAAAARQGR